MILQPTMISFPRRPPLIALSIGNRDRGKSQSEAPQLVASSFARGAQSLDLTPASGCTMVTPRRAATNDAPGFATTHYGVVSQRVSAVSGGGSRRAGFFDLRISSSTQQSGPPQHKPEGSTETTLTAWRGLNPTRQPAGEDSFVAPQLDRLSHIDGG
jgi:hypothetical protein